MNTWFLRCCSALLTLAFAVPAMASERQTTAADAPLAAQTSAPRAERSPLGARATPAERSRYAAREAASPEARQYRGGSAVIIISAGALALVLAIVLLVVLL
jgi:hypothetical protein